MKRVDSKARCDAEPCFVLHSYNYRETSLLVEVFSLNHGRVALVARGARRPHSAMRGLLLPFQPLLLDWFGKGELRTLHKAQWQGGQPQLSGDALLCGLYLNELLLKLLPREDAHVQLFAHYSEALQKLAKKSEHEATLRRFEIDLLSEIGYAPLLAAVADSADAVQAEKIYAYSAEKGPVAAASANENWLRVKGKTLLDMHSGDFSAPLTQLQAKALMRLLINHYLGAEPLYSRRLFQDLQTS